jgi:hypothetical protein
MPRHQPLLAAVGRCSFVFIFVCLALVSPLTTVSHAANIQSFDTAAPATVTARYPATAIAPDGSGFDGAYATREQYLASAGAFRVAIWESGPGVLVTDSYPNDEYCRVLEGTLTITNADGSTADFGPGDSFVIPRGWAGRWHMKTRFKKQFVAYTPEKTPN